MEIRFGAVLTAALFAVAPLFAGSPDVASLAGGILEVSDPCVSFFMRIVYPGWTGQAVGSGGETPGAGGLRRFGFSDPKKALPAALKAAGALHVTGNGAGGVSVHYRVTLPAALDAQQIGLQAELPADAFADGTLVADGKTFPVPRVKPDGAHLFMGDVRSAEFRSAAGPVVLRFDFPLPSRIEVMARRQEGPGGYTLRIPLGGKASYPAGTVLERAFAVSGPVPFAVNDGVPKERQAGPDWIPFMPDKDIVAGSACDWSGLRGEVKPCGTYGRVVVRGPHFEFENRPGVPVRFYGANVCFDACYMEHEKSDRLVELLARAGYNSVRLHHFDRKLTQGFSPDATALDPERMEKLDWFLSKCWDAGLYVTTDYFIGRLVPRAAVGLPGKGNVAQREFKEVIFTNSLLRANFKTYISNFLGHVNKYTGRRYADEPGFLGIAFINEGTPRPQSYPASAEEHCRLADLETDLAADLKAHVRDTLKCRIPVSNISSGWGSPALQLPRAKVYDYVDQHFYVDHPRFPVTPWCAPWQYNNFNPVRDALTHGFPRVLYTRLLDRPFVSTEYNYPAPMRYRMAGALLTGAAAALQDWDGVWRFEWTMNPDDAVAMDYRVPMRATGFDTPGDPLQLAGEGLFAALYLRGDLAPLDRTVAVTIDEKTLRASGNDVIQDVKKVDCIWSGWRVKTGTLVSPAAVPAGAEEWKYPEAFRRAPEAVAAAMPPDPRVSADPATGTFAVSTPRTCGIFTEGGRVAAGALAADVKDAAAAVWIISLDGAPLAETSRALLVHATNVESTGMPSVKTARSLTVYRYGKLPFLMERGTADVSLAVARGGWTVHALSPGGRRRRTVPHRFDANGRMRILCDTAADPAEATFLYELVR